MRDAEIKIAATKVTKLVPNLNNKKNYITHIRNLQCYLKNGLILTKVHRVAQFHQSAFMKPYINLNTAQRVIATNDSDKDFFKLMNNSVFGKTFENVRKRGNFELIGNNSRLRRVVSSRWFKSVTPISAELSLVQRYPKTVKLNRPAYIGAQILDLSKITVIDYFYDHILKEFSNVSLIATDTDSLMMKLSPKPDSTESIYETMWRCRHLYDFNNVTAKNGLYQVAEKYCNENGLDLAAELKKGKAIPGLMKNETAETEIKEMISIKAKQYAYSTVEGCEKTKGKLEGLICKGIRGDALKQ